MSNDQCITVSAPGKVLVAGGYLVLDRPNVGVVLASTARFFTSIKWSDEEVPTSVGAAGLVDDTLVPGLRIKVESPQFRSVYWYKCDFCSDGSLPVLSSSPDQAANTFVERVLAYVLGYLVEDACDKMVNVLSAARARGDVLAIKLRADNDFYSQMGQLLARGSDANKSRKTVEGNFWRFDALDKQLRSRGLPCTAEALASLPRFLECPVDKDGSVAVAKTGMGSSAALVSSLVGALLSFFGTVHLPCFDDASTGGPLAEGTEIEPEMHDSLALTHNLAQACHCVAQGKVGSGFDVSAAVYGTHTYTRFSPSELAEALAAADERASASAGTELSSEDTSDAPRPLGQIRGCVRGRGGWDAVRGPLRLPSCFRLLMGDVCGGSSTPSMVRKVQAWRANPSTAEHAKEVWRALGATNTTIAEVLNSVAAASAGAGDGDGHASFEAGAKVLASLPSSQWGDLLKDDSVDRETLQHLLNLKDSFATARKLLREVGEEAGVPIEPPVQTRLVDATAALPGVLSAGVPGAGGVDAVFAMVIHPDAETGVQDLWATWVVGHAEEKDTEARGVVCPLLLTASEGGPRGGILCTKGVAW